jgi:hypothetical protein
MHWGSAAALDRGRANVGRSRSATGHPEHLSSRRGYPSRTRGSFDDAGRTVEAKKDLAATRDRQANGAKGKPAAKRLESKH